MEGDEESASILGVITEVCKPIVVGLDFGTAFSGIAFSYRVDPGSIRCAAPTATDPATQLKVPTSLLELPDGTWEFGYNAEKTYNEHLIQSCAGEQLNVHLYKRFKMELKDKTIGFESLTARSATGKSQSLMLLVTKTIQFLKDFAMERIANGYGGDVSEAGVQWVICVPSIWNEFGKAFMRKAAFRAGLMEEEQSDNLLLVVEPEAASLAVHVGASHFNLLGPDSRFMVLDCGGGTVDITSYEVETVSPLKMKAIAIPAGGAWGGEYVNMEFNKFLKELLGEQYVEEEMPYERFVINEEFTRTKMVFDPAKDPSSLRLVDVLQDKRQLVELSQQWNENHPGSPIVVSGSLRNGFLTMSKELMLSFFEPCLKAVVDETRRQLALTPGIRHIMVVGGFGSSKVLIDRVRDEFNNKMGVRVICPDPNPRPAQAVAIGCVYYGLYADQLLYKQALHSYTLVVGRSGEPEDIVRRGQGLRPNYRVRFTFTPAAGEQYMLFRVLRDGEVVAKVVAECLEDSTRNCRAVEVTLLFAEYHLEVSAENARGDVSSCRVIASLREGDDF